jgi:hypothetical protein
MSKLTITYGATTINLNDRVNHILMEGYFPEVTTDLEEHVSETCKVQLRGNVSDLVRAINRAFTLARSSNESLNHVYINYAPGDSEAPWRSRIYDGAVIVDKSLGRAYPRSRLAVDISFERDPFWEGPEESIPLSNLNGTNQTGSLNVFSCNDLTGTAPSRLCNYMDIAAGVIKGDLETPIKLELKNLYPQALGTVWVGLNKTNPATARWLYEAESANGVTATTATGASGGKIVKGTATDASPLASLTWTLSAAELSAFAGQRVRFLARTHYMGAYSVFRYKLLLRSANITLFETDFIRESEEYARAWLELFDLRLPPWLEGLSNLLSIDMTLQMQLARAGSWPWAIDDIMLIPADSFIQVLSFVNQNERLVLDGIKGNYYKDNGAGIGRIGARKVIGGPLMLSPGLAQRLYLIQHGVQMDMAAPGMVVSAAAKYRPRRMSL